MKKYNSQKEFEAKIKDGIFRSEESIDITSFNLDVEAKIEVAGNIKAGNINAWDIKAGNINAWDIKAGNIKAGNIKAGNINAWDIKAGNINAGNINAGDINAEVVSYYAVVFAYKNIKVKSIKGRRENSKHFVLDGKLEVEEK